MGAASRIQEEIKQTRPFASRGQEAMVALLRTADVVRRNLSTVVEASGITLQQYNVLRILRGAGPDGLPTLEIGSRLLEQAPGTTRLVDRLVEKGLVERRGGRDRRQVLCVITREGLSLLGRLDTPVLAADGLLEAAGMTPRSLSHLVELLDAVRCAHAEAAPPASDRTPGAPRPNRTRRTR